MIQESLDMEAQPIVPGNSNRFSRKQGKVFGRVSFIGMMYSRYHPTAVVELK